VRLRLLLCIIRSLPVVLQSSLISNRIGLSDPATRRVHGHGASLTYS
jgi:hypothetical protein